MFPHYVCEPPPVYLCAFYFCQTSTGEPDIQSSPKDGVKDTVLSESQFFLPGSGLTKKLYFDRYASNIADVANIKSP